MLCYQEEDEQSQGLRLCIKEIERDYHADEAIGSNGS